ncbi:MAG: L,D-transpeptidase family protein [Hyphomicrobiales bacterium]|nr:L,D-transpeptidase family protein [Hyphomicrobiales bacterium]
MFLWFRLPVLILAFCASTVAARAEPLGEPAFSPVTYQRTVWAYEGYRALYEKGGWPDLPAGVAGLMEGAEGPAVAALKQRLILMRDMAPDAAENDLFDQGTREGVRHFQRRHGLTPSGKIGERTLRALAVPIDMRLKQMWMTLERMRQTHFSFPERYIVLNIPGATIEAVDDGQTSRRHVAVVGRPDRQSPLVSSRLATINLNPTWTVPTSIIRNDLGPKIQADPLFLQKHGMHVFGPGGIELDPASIDWSGRNRLNVSIRQDPGPANSLGRLRLDMPNIHAVYMHDTPQRDLFRSDARFHSSGCARVEDVVGLAAWALEGTDWNRARLESEIAAGSRIDIRLAKPVPVIWVYLTGWAAADGTIQFREDIYGFDEGRAPQAEAEKDVTGSINQRPAGIADLIGASPARR